MGKEYTREQLITGYSPLFGQLILLDDMQGALNWLKTGTGSDYRVELSTDLSYFGTKSLFIMTRETNPAANDYVKAYRSSFLLPSKQIILSLLFYLGDHDIIKSLDIVFNCSDTSYVSQSGLLYLQASKKWQYYGSDGSYHDIPGATGELRDYSWHRLDLCIDFLNQKYIKFSINSRSFDLSSYSLYSLYFPESDYLTLSLILTNSIADVAMAYIGAVLIKEI